MVNVPVYLSSIALFLIGIQEVHPFQVKHMEGLSSNHTNIPIFVKPLRCVPTLVSVAHFNHSFSWLLQKEFLVVEEAVWGLQSGKFAQLIPEAFNSKYATTNIFVCRFFIYGTLYCQSSMENFVTKLVSNATKPNHIDHTIFFLLLHQ